MTLINAGNLDFSAQQYDAAIASIRKLDGVYMRVHPCWASAVEWTLEKTPQRIPMVIDTRVETRQIDFCDAATGTVLARVGELALPAAFAYAKEV